MKWEKEKQNASSAVARGRTDEAKVMYEEQDNMGSHLATWGHGIV